MEELYVNSAGLVGRAHAASSRIFAASPERILLTLCLPAAMLSLSMYAGMGMGPSELAARYRECAAKCIALASKRENAKKLSMLDMAQAWLDLADLAMRNERLQVVYETPEGEMA